MINVKCGRPPKDEFLSVVCSMPTSDVANHYGVSVATVNRWRNGYGIRPTGIRPRKVKDEDRFLSDYELFGAKAMAMRYGTTLSTVYTWARNIRRKREEARGDA